MKRDIWRISSDSPPAMRFFTMTSKFLTFFSDCSMIAGWCYVTRLAEINRRIARKTREIKMKDNLFLMMWIGNGHWPSLTLNDVSTRMKKLLNFQAMSWNEENIEFYISFLSNCCCLCYKSFNKDCTAPIFYFIFLFNLIRLQLFGHIYYGSSLIEETHYYAV